jgi:anthranilate synthase/aminodeoxychorismate synthase-like glutamine amidotransferase
MTNRSILLIDNYDSFVFNLARYLEELGVATQVVRNDAMSVAEVAAREPAAIVISPGPCTPREAGISLEVVRQLGGRIPMLGVCLGHQAMAEALGGRIVRAREPVHGRTSLVEHAGEGLFAGLPNPLRAGRYHSLVADPDTLPAELTVTARTAEGIIMAFQHTRWPLWGVQFHPESILTEGGHRLLANFLRLAGLEPAALPTGDLAPNAFASGQPDESWPNRPLHWWPTQGGQ